MSCEGIWKIEMLGPYGWETVSTAILDNGRFFAASAEHYSIGHYEEDSDTIKVFTRVTQHGKSRAIFGGERKEFDVRMEGAVKSESVILGKVYPSDNDSLDVHLHLTRLQDLD